MNPIDIMLEKNITFNLIDKHKAERIMQNEYAYYMLMKLSSVFEKKKKSNEEKFINLDFGQLYYLAKIDSQLSQILMGLCLKIEKSLKTRLIYDAEKVCNTEMLMNEYYSNESDHLNKTYTSNNIEIIKNENFAEEIKNMNFYQFLDVVQFGTLEKFVHFFYKKFSMQIYKKEFPSFETRLYAVRRIRNIVAHNNSIIAKLQEKTEYKNLKISAMLGNNGIKNKTLKTNMSKAVISDLCDLLYVYYELVDDGGELLYTFVDFDNNYIKKYKDIFCKNDLLRTVYAFLKNVIEIFSQKKLDKYDNI